MENTDITRSYGFFDGPETLVEIIKPSESVMLPLEESYEIAMISAAMDPQDVVATSDNTKPSATLYATYKGKTVVLCTLRPETLEQFSLTQVFDFYEESEEDEDDEMPSALVLSCKGAFPIHMVALVQANPEIVKDGEGPQGFGGMMGADEMDMDSEDDEDSEGCDDEVCPDLIANTLKNSSSASIEELSESEEEATETLVAPEVVEVVTAPVKAAAPVEVVAKLSKSAKRKINKDLKAAEAAKVVAAASPVAKKAKVEVAAPVVAPVVAKPNSPAPVKQAKVVSKVVEGVTIVDTMVGKGPVTKKGKSVALLYKGSLTNGKKFDSCTSRKQPFTFRYGMGEVVRGMDIGLKDMRVGGKRTITIPSGLAYGKKGAGNDIPPNSTLVFELELLKA